MSIIKTKLVKLTFAAAPVVMLVSIFGAGLKSFPIIHEPKVPSRLRNV